MEEDCQVLASDVRLHHDIPFECSSTFSFLPTFTPNDGNAGKLGTLHF